MMLSGGTLNADTSFRGLKMAKKLDATLIMCEQCGHVFLYLAVAVFEDAESAENHKKLVFYPDTPPTFCPKCGMNFEGEKKETEDGD